MYPAEGQFLLQNPSVNAEEAVEQSGTSNTNSFRADVAILIIIYMKLQF
jgi:hypothetical protein